MTIGLLNNLFGVGQQTYPSNVNNGCSASNKPNSGGGLFGRSFGLKQGLLGSNLNIISNLLGSINGSSAGGGSCGMGSSGGSRPHGGGSSGWGSGISGGGNSNGGTSGAGGSCGCSSQGSNSISYGGQASTVSGGGNAGLVGIGNALSSASGSPSLLNVGALAGGSLSAVGTAAGGIAQGVHHLAENIIGAVGLQPVFGPLVDAPIIHPLLWDPISKLTGVDVSKHPLGVADASDPLNIRG